MALLMLVAWSVRGHPFACDHDLYLAASAAAAVAAALLVLGAFGRRVPEAAIYGSAMLWWAAWLLVAVLFLPGAILVAMLVALVMPAAPEPNTVVWGRRMSSFHTVIRHTHWLKSVPE